ncbi:MAG: fructose-6-phosphate aldolase [Planctomycetes bacterium]|nr:fructose-6-phosphate aldolase [Planctomycetota bacterium]
MKLFLDTADVKAVRRAHATGLLDGVTTNPAKIAEAGRPFLEVVREIASITPGPVSAEAMSATAGALVDEAVHLASLAPNIAVKLPMTVEGLTACGVLEREKNVRTNVTMVFSAPQAFLAMKAGATFVSIVLSRLDAVGNDSEILVNDAAAIKQNYGFASEIIAGSVKTTNQVMACLRAGIDIATVPESVFFQLFQHPLTDVGLAQFAEVWKGVKA